MTFDSTPPRWRAKRSRPDASGDPVIAALTELLHAERAEALQADRLLVERYDPCSVWLLWFAIGATEATCALTQNDADQRRNQIFRQIVSVIFDGGGTPVTASRAQPAHDGPRLIRLFEAAGSEAVQACMRGETRLGHYLEALKAAAEAERPPVADWTDQAR